MHEEAALARPIRRDQPKALMKSGGWRFVVQLRPINSPPFTERILQPV
jgi:hypothetical protein